MSFWRICRGGALDVRFYAGVRPHNPTHPSLIPVVIDFKQARVNYARLALMKEYAWKLRGTGFLVFA